MDMYMVGGVTGAGNLRPLWRKIYQKLGERDMDIFMAGCYSRPWCISQWYEAAGLPVKVKGKKPATAEGHKPYILESFYYVADDPFIQSMIPHFGKFLLDSGAFTLFSDKKKGAGIVWEEYVDKYADFIVRNDVRLFFELDIDALVGIDKVLELRRRLERKAGRPCIPVWHKSRGKESFLKMCDKYKYVAIGGIVSKEITPDQYRFFPWFISEAHRRGAKIHGLGFTALASLPKYHFDSVDSTAWVTGNRFGMVYHFDGKGMSKVVKGEGQRLKDSRAVAINNFNEWVKFQQYATTHL